MKKELLQFLFAWVQEVLSHGEHAMCDIFLISDMKGLSIQAADCTKTTCSRFEVARNMLKKPTTSS